jgi:CHAT domain-containing protein
MKTCCSKMIARMGAAVLLYLAATSYGIGQHFVAPPRTITDITAILDGEEPDLKKIEGLRNAADVLPPTNGSREDLAKFYYDRGNARAQLGRLAESIADADKAVDVARGAVNLQFLGRLEKFAGLQYAAAGDPKQAMAIFSRLIAETANDFFARNYQFGINRSIAGILIQMGNIEQAEDYLHRSMSVIEEYKTSDNPDVRRTYSVQSEDWEADIELHRSIILEARGLFRDAESSYKIAEQRRRDSVKSLLSLKYPTQIAIVLQTLDSIILNQARMKAKQGRLMEAEADARRALLARLKDQGKYHPGTPRFILGLAGILVEQGRYAEAEKLVRSAIEVNRTVGVASDSLTTAQILSQLGAVLDFERKTTEAAAAYAELDKAISSWDPQRRKTFELNGSRITSLYASGQIDAGIAAAHELVEHQIAKVGVNHIDTAEARGTLAIGLAKAGRNAEAIQEFKSAIPVLVVAARENANDDDTSTVALRNLRLQNIVEAYIGVLSRGPQSASNDIAGETFSLADSVRSHSVQQALAASSARMVANDPAMAKLVREEQDFSKELNAQLGTLNNALALPADQRDEKGIRDINATVAKFSDERDRARKEIVQRFPNYVDLIDPRPPTVDQIKATLADGEALLSFYFGREASFVWAVPKEGSVVFAAIDATGGEIESRVRKLREALEPQATIVSDIPPFDLKLGYELYSLLLKPVEAGWKQSNSLIVVTNGALGLLPLSLLPTAPAEIKVDDEPPFSSYRTVPWLVRTHAVTIVPSSAALHTLRHLPPGSPRRGEMFGFGDPLFNTLQAADAEREESKIKLADTGTAVMRGVPLKRRSSPQLESVDSAELGMLPRLPDTAEELKSIALALQADPSKVLKLRKDANEQAVKTMDLTRFKVLVFATHGLVSGELDGLTQPALALSAPAVAGVPGDGLLTMEEILTLKLDADWVVLSACNTGAGAGAGAEAASGLGRAFFYAGTRALLVTNWSVHSQSAKQLVTELFKRQAHDQKLTRGEALRQAMMAMVDGPGYLSADEKTEFSYAHPLFWAPYSIIGDGGRP